jgi:DHA1 family multidrug resistance protein-like MFS transporter
MAIASSNVPKEKLGESLGFLQTGQITGTVIGPLIGGILSQAFGMKMSFFIAGTLLSLVAAIVIFYVREPKKAAAVNEDSSIFSDLKLAAKNHRLVEMLSLVMFLQMAIMILQPVITLYVGQLEGKMDDAAFYAGIIFSCAGLSGALVAPLWGRLGQRHGYYRAIWVAFLGAGIINALFYLPDNVLMFTVLQFFFGLFIVGVSPSVSALIVICTEPGFRGRVFGLSTTAHQAGSMLGPLVGGFLSLHFGIRPLFIITGAFLLLLSFFMYSRHEGAKKSS